MVPRILHDVLQEQLFQGKALLLIGPRQVGKTTLVREVLRSRDDVLTLNGDDPDVQRLLTDVGVGMLRRIIANDRIVFIDEGQRIPALGWTSKMIFDEFPDVQLIVSGSSAFELGQNMQEPLTGRKRTFQLYPIAWTEWERSVGVIEAEGGLEDRLVHGMYPDVINHPQAQADALYELTESYLYKDVLAYAGLRKPAKLQALVQALALQVGSEVSESELARTVGIDQKTVGQYIEVLEQAFIIFRLTSFSRNQRKEIRKGKKVYFVDNGVRNAVIGRLSPLALRNDVGALWENFLVSERRKELAYTQRRVATHFWRTRDQQEVDYIEVDDAGTLAVEFKWAPRSKTRIPRGFLNRYDARTMIVSRSDFRGFLEM